MTASSNVLVGVPDKASGGIYIADDVLGVSEYPLADLSSAPADMEAAGFISEDGVTESNESETERIRAWGGDTVRVVQTDHTVTYSFTFLESKNATVLRAVYGDDNVDTTGDVITVNVNSDVLPHQSWSFEMKDGDNRIRVFVPDGQITTRGEITYTHTGAIQYEVTVEAFPDSDGNKAIKVIDDGSGDGGSGEG